MAQHLDKGKYGELKAIEYLKQLGYEINAVNWRYKYWEVDIIAKDGDVLVFVEVKSRTHQNYGDPIDFVDSKKQKNLIEAADHYLDITSYEGEIRFDIVSVYLESEKIDLVKDAFWSE